MQFEIELQSPKQRHLGAEARLVVSIAECIPDPIRDMVDLVYLSAR